MTQGFEREAEGRIPAITERERAKGEQGLSAVALPSRAAAAHPHLDEALAGGLDAPAADVAAFGARRHVAHTVGLVGQVCDGVMDWHHLADLLPFATAVFELAPNLSPGMGVVQQTHLPLAQPPRALFASEENRRRLPELLH